MLYSQRWHSLIEDWLSAQRKTVTNIFLYRKWGSQKKKCGKFPGIWVAVTQLKTAPSCSVCQNYLFCHWTTLQGYLLLQRVWLHNVHEVLQKKHFIITPKYLRQFSILSKAVRDQHVISAAGVHASGCRISPNLKFIFFSLHTHIHPIWLF